MRLITSILLLAVISVSAAQFMTLTQVIKSDPNFSTLYKLLQATGLDQTLNGNVLFTVFAPNNTAFNAVPAATLKYLLDPANGNLLSSVLEYHVVSGDLHSSALANYNNNTLITTQGSAINLEVSSPFMNFSPLAISLNNARVIKANVAASNGVLHAIDKVLLNDLRFFQPSVDNLYAIVSQNPQLSILKSLLDRTGLDQVLQSTNAQYTLFAPTNDAFTDPILASIGSADPAILKNVLLYHVLAGKPVYSTSLYDGLQASPVNANNNNIPPVTFRRLQFPGAASVTVNDANILTVDNLAINGVLHTIDRVLLPYSY